MIKYTVCSTLISVCCCCCCSCCYCWMYLLTKLYWFINWLSFGIVYYRYIYIKVLQNSLSNSGMVYLYVKHSVKNRGSIHFSSNAFLWQNERNYKYNRLKSAKVIKTLLGNISHYFWRKCSKVSSSFDGHLKVFFCQLER